jgi:thiol:disulfide interchange protein
MQGAQRFPGLGASIDLETLHQNGEHAVPMSTENFPSFVESNNFVFANFFAPWCVWCQVSANVLCFDSACGYGTC